MKFLNQIKAANNDIKEIRKLGFEITNTDLALEVGETKYDPDAETLVTRITENDYLRHGQMQIVKVRNKTGSVIPKGTAVYVTGGIANSPILLISPANNNDILQARRFIGLTTTSISNNSFGKVITSGVIEGLNLPTSEWEVGQCAYVTTNGQYVNTPPEKGEGRINIRVGMVIRVGNNTGAILVFSRFQPFLEMLSNVKITDPQSGDVLTYDADLDIWINAQPEDLQVAAEQVSYDNVSSGVPPQNVQTALDQIFYMFRFLTVELNGGGSSSNYDPNLAIDGGLSDSIFGNNFDSGTSRISQLNTINGGGSEQDVSASFLGGGISSTQFSNTSNGGDSTTETNNIINGGES